MIFLFFLLRGQSVPLDQSLEPRMPRACRLCPICAALERNSAKGARIQAEPRSGGVSEVSCSASWPSGHLSQKYGHILALQGPSLVPSAQHFLLPHPSFQCEVPPPWHLLLLGRWGPGLFTSGCLALGLAQNRHTETVQRANELTQVAMNELELTCLSDVHF